MAMGDGLRILEPGITGGTGGRFLMHLMALLLSDLEATATVKAAGGTS